MHLHYLKPTALDDEWPEFSLATFPLGGMGYDLCDEGLTTTADYQHSIIRCTLDEDHDGPHAWHMDGDVALVWESDAEYAARIQRLDEIGRHDCPFCIEAR